MFDLLMIIIIRWLTGVLPGGDVCARAKLLRAPVLAEVDPWQVGVYPATSPGLGWMMLRLEPVPRAYVSSRSALARMAGGDARAFRASR